MISDNHIDDFRNPKRGFRMKVISVIQQKGGAGKTTVAVHLAHDLKALMPKLRITIADADPQQSALNWINRGLRRGIKGVNAIAVASDGSGKALRREIIDIQSDIVIIDLPPAIEAVSLRAALYADLMLVPVGASVLDLEAAKAAIDVCEEAIAENNLKRFLIVPTRVQPHTAAGKELREVLMKWGPVSQGTIGLRVSFADAATLGEGITTFAPNTAAHQEIRKLAKETMKLLGVN